MKTQTGRTQKDVHQWVLRTVSKPQKATLPKKKGDDEHNHNSQSPCTLVHYQVSLHVGLMGPLMRQGGAEAVIEPKALGAAGVQSDSTIAQFDNRALGAPLAAALEVDSKWAVFCDLLLP